MDLGDSLDLVCVFRFEDVTQGRYSPSGDL